MQYSQEVRTLNSIRSPPDRYSMKEDYAAPILLMKGRSPARRRRCRGYDRLNRRSHCSGAQKELPPFRSQGVAERQAKTSAIPWVDYLVWESMAAVDASIEAPKSPEPAAIFGQKWMTRTSCGRDTKRSRAADDYPDRHFRQRQFPSPRLRSRLQSTFGATSIRSVLGKRVLE